MILNTFSHTLVLCVAISIISAYDRDEDEYFKVKHQQTINDITKFCSERSKTDFCSMLNLKSMFNVLQNQREENMRNVMEKAKTRIDFLNRKKEQLKLRNFLVKNPKYKFLREFGLSRFF